MEPRGSRRGSRGGQLLGVVPIEHSPKFLAAFHDVATGFDTTFLSLNGEVEMWVKSALLPEQWEKWNEHYETLCKELML